LIFHKSAFLVNKKIDISNSKTVNCKNNIFQCSKYLLSQGAKFVIGKKYNTPHFCTMNGGNKRIAAKRYVHGIIQIQVTRQVLLLKLGGLAEPESPA